MMNAHFINELDKIGLQLINIRGTLIGRLVYWMQYHFKKMSIAHHAQMLE